MAGRIPQRFIDELLERVDIVDVIDTRVPLKKAGKDYSARCPFHDEKSPSFSVSPDKQFYYCFGCGAGGNAIGFLMEYERLEFVDAVEKLAQTAGLEVPREDGGKAGPTTRQVELLKRLENAASWFQKQLRDHPQAGVARAYLAKRGLTPQTIERFQIGYAPPGWDSLLKALGGTDADRKLMLDAGLMIRRDDGGLYDRFRERVMFPIQDNRGRTVAFGGRVLTDEKPKYLNSPETPVFHKGQELFGLYQARRANRDLDRMLVVEGYMDVVMLAQHGIDNAVGTLGTALSSSHLQRLYRYTPTVVFCFDGDEAGRRAAARSLELVLPALQDGRQAAFLFLPEGEDPDTLVQGIGAEAFREQIARAKPLSEFLFEHHAEGLDLEQPDGKARFSTLVLPAINRIPGAVYRELLRGQVADRIGVAVDRLPTASELKGQGRSGERALTPQSQNSSRAWPAPTATAPGERDENVGAGHARDQSPTGTAYPVGAGHARDSQGPTRRQPLTHTQRKVQGSVRTALRLILKNPRLASEIDDPARFIGLEDPELGLLMQVLEYLRIKPDATMGALLGYWYGSTEGELLTRLAAEEPLPGADAEGEFGDVVAHLAARAGINRAEGRRRELERIPFTDLSPAQKQEYLALLAPRASPT